MGAFRTLVLNLNILPVCSVDNIKVTLSLLFVKIPKSRPN